MVKKLLSYAMASVTVKTRNSPNRQSEKRKRKRRTVPFDAHWTGFLKIPIYDKKFGNFFKYWLLAGKGLNGRESNINYGLFFPGTAVQTGNF